MNRLQTWFTRTLPSPAVTTAPLTSQRPAQLVQSVRALVRDVTVPGTALSVAELIVDVRGADGDLHVLLRAPDTGLKHVRELRNEIRDLLLEVPDVRHVAVEVVLAVH